MNAINDVMNAINDVMNVINGVMNTINECSTRRNIVPMTQICLNYLVNDSTELNSCI